MQIAVIDLGTNTFNLLIAEKGKTGIEVLRNEKISVKLGRGGIGKRLVLPDAIERAMSALKEFKGKIDSENISKTFALGTSALRTAENSDDFIKLIQEQLGFEIEIISGEREAELIYLCVRQTIQHATQPFLIIDIGGGSNELIIANSAEILWKESFPIGMARLNEKFKPSDPVKPEEILALEEYFEQEMQVFFEVIKNLRIEFIAGAEGAFETFYNMSGYCFGQAFEPGLAQLAKQIKIENYIQIHNTLIASTLQERLSMKGMEKFRVEMVVPASIFVNYVLKKIKTQTIFVSPFSLKEGVAWEYFFSGKV